MEEQTPIESVKVLKLQRGGVPLKDWMGGNKINQESPQESTKLNYSPRVNSASAKKMEEAQLLRRKQGIANSKKVMAEKGEFSREAFATTAMGDKARFFPNEVDNPLDEYANPFKMVGDLADNIGHAWAGGGSAGQKAMSVAAPLAVGALGGLAKGTTTGQFVNNVMNPLAGTGELLKNATVGMRSKFGTLINDARTSVLPNKVASNLLKVKPLEEKIITAADRGRVGAFEYKLPYEDVTRKADPTLITAKEMQSKFPNVHPQMEEAEALQKGVLDEWKAAGKFYGENRNRIESPQFDWLEYKHYKRGQENLYRQANGMKPIPKRTDIPKSQWDNYWWDNPEGFKKTADRANSLPNFVEGATEKMQTGFNDAGKQMQKLDAERQRMFARDRSQLVDQNPDFMPDVDQNKIFDTNSVYRSGSSNNEWLHQQELFGEPVRPSFITDPNWSVMERVDNHAKFLERRKAWDTEHKAWLDAPRGTEEQKFAVDYGNKWNQQWLADPVTQHKLFENNLDLMREGKKMIDPKHQFKTKIPTQREMLELRRLGVGPKENYGVQVGNIPDPAYDNISNKAFVHTDPNALLMESTSVHEGGHDLTRGQQGFGSKAKQLTQDLYGGAEGIAELKRKNPQEAWEQIDYLSNPAETRERTQELRFFYNMKPGDHVSLERAGEIMRDVQNDVTPVSPNWGRMFKSDKAVADLFNKLFTPAAVVGAGIASQKKSQP